MIIPTKLQGYCLLGLENESTFTVTNSTAPWAGNSIQSMWLSALLIALLCCLRVLKTRHYGRAITNLCNGGGGWT